MQGWLFKKKKIMLGFLQYILEEIFVWKILFFFFFFFFLANRELGYMESKTKWSSPTKDFQKKKWYIKYKLSKGNGQKSDIHMYFGQKAKKMVAKISS
jgi:hypothetical protein